ncbi:hypothetical protein [Trinickia fusca]|uniref:TM2 domain-containing protein n=1 Tax=Trinickia fusca TaxID=2419777 RepID=A0A494XAL4_9BURK|nr:hypothetical protein [Trinickia fusca]RKP47598.1 hypothetical protein D7S89_15340 [Trinickia fusca]
MNLENLKAQLAKMNLAPKSLSLAYALAVCIGGLGLQQLYLGKYKSWLWRFGLGWLVIALAIVVKADSLHVFGPVWFLALIWLFLNVVTDWLTLWRQVLKVNERINQAK